MAPDEAKIVDTYRTGGRQGLVFFLTLVLLGASACGGRKVPMPPPTVKRQPAPSPPAKPPDRPAPTATVPDRPITQPPLTAPDRPATGATATPPPASGSGPVLRIGLLPTAMRVTISADSRFYLQPKHLDKPRVPVTGTITVTLEGKSSPPAAASKIYRVQIASFTRVRDAEALHRQLEEEEIGPVSMQFNPEAAAYRIRVGQYESRAAASEAAEHLRQKRYRQAMVVQENIPAADQGGERSQVLVASGSGINQRTANGFRILPSAPEKFIKVNGKPYRGIIETLPTRNEKMTIVNEVVLEEYLKGVVPEELPPRAFPELEALKAQAIAARTYALRNKGQFRSEGYDLLASDRSQVYGGAAAEQPLSNQAVADTAGWAIFAQGELVNALYTSTCGGRTEDNENIFGGKAVSYLRGITCAIDREAAGVAAGEIRGRARRSSTARDGSGKHAQPELALLRIMDILQDAETSEANLDEIPARAEIRGWVGRAADALKRKPARDSGAEGAHLEKLAYFGHYLIDRLFARRAAEVLLSEADAEYYLAGFRDTQDIPKEARRTLAFLVQKGVLIPYPDNTLRPQLPLSRGSALGLLYRTLESLSALPLESGKILKTEGATLYIKNGRETLEISTAANLYLFQRIGRELIATDALRVIGGEEVRFHRRNGKVDYLEVKLGAGGASNDRFSRFTQWEAALTAEEATKKLRQIFNLGRLLDMQPVKYGSSGRVTELKIVGSRGEFALKGQRIRTVLGLRDTLFTTTREQAADGAVDRYLFSGRGWGHGVGLCQTGAYGMAMAGETAESILKKYYTGVELKKAYE